MKENKVFKARFRDGCENAAVSEVVQYAKLHGLLENIHVTTEKDPQTKKRRPVLLADENGIKVIEKRSYCFS